MSTSNNVKKSILTDWHNEFKYLSPYAQNKLYKMVGPVIVGIEIFKLPRTDDYRPYFVCYPLWKSNEKDCLEEPILFQEILNKRGLQFNIPYLRHIDFYQEAMECTKKQLPISLDNDVSLKNLYSMINNQFSLGIVRASPVGYIKLLEAKILCSLYVNDLSKNKSVFIELNEFIRSCNPDFLEWKYGKIDNWLKNLQVTISKRDDFLKQIEINKQDKKIARLQSSELTV